jgi:hypothetical protein
MLVLLNIGMVVLSKEFVRKKYCMAELRILLQRLHAQQQQQQASEEHAAQQHTVSPSQCAAGPAPGHQPNPLGAAPSAGEASASTIIGGLAGLALANRPGSKPLPVRLLPVLFELTVEQLCDMRELYDSEPWCGDKPKPSSAALDAWAADLKAVARITMIRPDQVSSR